MTRQGSCRPMVTCLSHSKDLAEVNPMKPLWDSCHLAQADLPCKVTLHRLSWYQGPECCDHVLEEHRASASLRRSFEAAYDKTLSYSGTRSTSIS